MRKQNLIQLTSGVNQIQISQEDLGNISSKIPIANLPDGFTVKNIYMNIVQLFKSPSFGGQTNPE